jgi:hypothetical protein
MAQEIWPLGPPRGSFASAMIFGEKDCQIVNRARFAAQPYMVR